MCPFLQTHCSRGCSIKIFVIHWFIKTVTLFLKIFRTPAFANRKSKGSWYFERRFERRFLDVQKFQSPQKMCWKKFLVDFVKKKYWSYIFLKDLMNNQRKLMFKKLDGVGPVDNRPSPNKLHRIVKKKKQNLICDTWHVTCDTWHVTSDMWHMTHDMLHIGEDQHSLKISAP